MAVRNLDRIFKARRIALLGVGADSSGIGRTILKNLLGGDFPGAVYPVDAEHEAIQGIPTFPDLAGLPHAPDLALICGPAEAVPGLVRDCGQAGIRGALIFSEGFREAGAAGEELEAQLRAEAARFDGLRIMGPNSLGIIAPHAQLNASGIVTRPLAGHIAFISQSRALCNAIVDWATEQGIGFSGFVSIGNMLNVGFGDLIDYFNADSHTRAIILYVQSIDHARRFMSAARAFARVKPIVAYKAGRYSESAKVAASHTGAMVAEDAVYGAAFERAGVVRVTELDDVFDVAELLASRRLPKGPGLAILSNAGGPAIIATDALLARGGTLSRLAPDTTDRLSAVLPPGGSHANPVDLLDDAPPARFAEVAEIVLADPGVDAVLIIFATQAGCDPRATAQAVVEAASRGSKPLLAAWMGGDKIRAGVQCLNEAGIATHATPEQAVRAFMHLVSYASNLESLYETSRELAVRFDFNRNKLRRRLAPRLHRLHPGQLADDLARALLQVYGIPFVATAIARSGEEAARIGTRLGYPVVLKIVSPNIPHKLDVGGVALDLPDAEAVVAAFDRMLESAAAHGSLAEIKGVAVQPMLKPKGGVELILGAKKDPTFGTVVMVGSGGVTTDLLRDQALGLPPLNERLTRRMLESLRLWPILEGYRGQPRLDLDRLIEIVIRFSHLAADYPEFQEIEINPLLITPNDVIALDVAMVVEAKPAAKADHPHPHLAIRPYPDEYARRGRLKDGSPVTLRSVRPEDEAGWHELIAGASADSLRFRFRSLFKKSTHQMAAQYCFIDYEREIGIVAEVSADGAGALVGAAHLIADMDHHTGEFAILVADAWQGKGLGGLLLDYCLELARRWGLKRVVAETHPQNRPMLAAFRSRGFAIRIALADESAYVEKLLAAPEPRRRSAKRQRASGRARVRADLLKSPAQ
jgi:acetyltransferase